MIRYIWSYWHNCWIIVRAARWPLWHSALRSCLSGCLLSCVLGTGRRWAAHIPKHYEVGCSCARPVWLSRCQCVFLASFLFSSLRFYFSDRDKAQKVVFLVSCVGSILLCQEVASLWLRQCWLARWAAGSCRAAAAQLRPALRGPMDCGPPGFCVHGIPSGQKTGVGCHLLLYSQSLLSWVSTS